ncbi:hypothetical protein [Paenibacillus agri]|uniref:Uncharacterized protein n=1 Tax=Paenibacillus agri TaxID=2744309 RepID=A0A850ENI8_9BACL|nr:hypothetical protein [Paenibacillus agri]NUU61996.1 hypothetical protein [Paenibacillus agri]
MVIMLAHSVRMQEVTRAEMAVMNDRAMSLSTEINAVTNFETTRIFLRGRKVVLLT